MYVVLALHLSIIEVAAAMLQTFLNQLRTMSCLEVCPKSVRRLGMSPQPAQLRFTVRVELKRRGRAELVGAA